ncbi:peptidase a1 protein [Rutstroemia sp. NJR-2017a WRK4]|nr:peptidase a1 protein [Rutstroemia sp. NJR-2017a WRK4]
MKPSSSLLALPVLAASAANADADAGVISMPIRFLYGALNKISTSVVVGSSANASAIEVVVDFGSSDFWIFGPNATINYGSPYLGFTGQCNTSPSAYYHPSAAHPISNFSAAYAYGGNSKILTANAIVNDTLSFPSSPSPSRSIPNIEVALVNHGSVRQAVASDAPCPDLSYDLGILGLAPRAGNGDQGPNVKADLLEMGRIKGSVASMYFSPAPANASIEYEFQGEVLFGELPPRDSYEGELLPVPIATQQGEIGYYVAQPNFSHANTTIPSDFPDTTCLLDSGSLAITLPYEQNTTAFLNATGLQEYQYTVVYPSACEEIPRGLTLDFEFTTGNGTEKGMVKVPYRNLARGDPGPGGVLPEGMCALSLGFASSCTLGAPWFTASSVGVDDGEGVVWVGQGRL